MAPLLALHVKEDDMSEAHWDVKDKSENLVSKVCTSLSLSLIFECILGTSGAFVAKSEPKPNDHSDKAKWDIDRQEVIERHEVDIHKSSCQENSLSQPLDHMENRHQCDAQIIDSGSLVIISCFRNASVSSSGVTIVINPSYCPNEMVAVAEAAESCEGEPLGGHDFVSNLWSQVKLEIFVHWFLFVFLFIINFLTLRMLFY